jgi:hypothetical protein
MPQIFNKIIDKDVVRQRAKTDYSHGLPVVHNHRHCKAAGPRKAQLRDEIGRC